MTKLSLLNSFKNVPMIYIKSILKGTLSFQRCYKLLDSDLNNDLAQLQFTNIQLVRNFSNQKHIHDEEKRLKRRLNLTFKSPAPNAYNLSLLRIKDRQDFNRASCSRAFQSNIAVKCDKYQQQLPSPCDYQKVDRSLKSKVGMAVFKSSSERLFDLSQSATYTPGPGHYEIDVKRNDSNLPQSAFASKSERLALNNASEYPGPGTYDLIKCHYDSTLKISKLPSTKSTLSGTISKVITKNQENYPGPGTYNIATDLLPKHFMSSSVFLSNVPRWIIPNIPVSLGIGDMAADNSSLTCAGGMDALNNPGPTRYNPHLPQKISFHYNLNNEWVY
ncbi:O(6)-methylguanine-induced apoptosis 2 [Schistosoma japonicum]|nr:O(6)-methylguanine-induced apoptosis 2 [Schistosoma japonicum]